MGDAGRYAVVTGANKGLGFEIVKQVANSGVTVLLTARNEKRGMEAISLLNKQGFPNVVFHQLDVQDAQTIESLAKFIQTQYGRLDILYTVAGQHFGISGFSPFSSEVLKALPQKIFQSQGILAMAVNIEKAAPRYAVVTGANKGIGFETVKQLENSGVTVILTARNEKRGMEATSLLNKQGFSNIVFHQLDVQDAQSIESLAKFIQTQYGRLDILLAGKAANVAQVAMKTTYESAKLCLDTNYYGVKNVTEALLPLLQNSPSARIVNVSSLRSELKRVPNEERRKELGDIENLTEDKIEKILQKFLHDLKQDALEVNGLADNATGI
ncbi:short-chain dehydrogenasereductase 2b [Nicotiana attenuata]|uniref:Short-chain dehydrogenasereductase 2b n=1 Tax=Nicotiana attenuata TaxID=49451 RepID=A0A1J6KX76_NICAT|nr:short-chain dehydrogenasereductase 2b [Nicotiana attenuata]